MTFRGSPYARKSIAGGMSKTRLIQIALAAGAFFLLKKFGLPQVTASDPKATVFAFEIIIISAACGVFYLQEIEDIFSKLDGEKSQQHEAEDIRPYLKLMLIIAIMAFSFLVYILVATGSKHL
jgi:hypothetical protein